MNAKLQAIHLVDEGVYLVEAKWGYEYEVDGIRAPKNREFVVKSPESILQVQSHAGEIVYWKDDDGKTILPLDYNDKRAELLAGTSDDGELTFPTLDAEFAFRKFMERWKTPVRSEPTTTKTPVEFDVVEIRTQSGDPDIHSQWNAPTVTNDRKLYSLARDTVMLRTCREQCGAADLPLDIPSHSALRYAKIDGNYAFDDSFTESKRPFVGTLEQCKAEKAKCIARVTDVVSVYAAKKRNVLLNNAGQVLLELHSLKRNMLGVRAKQDSGGSLMSAHRQLDKLIEQISASI